MDVRIGIIHSAKELDVELNDTEERESVVSQIEAALSQPAGVLWLTDKRGRRVAVPTAKIAYVELGSGNDDRRVGFGAQ